jgi:hypothetical protein
MYVYKNSFSIQQKKQIQERLFHSATKASPATIIAPPAAGTVHSLLQQQEQFLLLYEQFL